jgi:hypothetical protein
VFKLSGCSKIILIGMILRKCINAHCQHRSQSIGRENDEMANMKYMYIGSNTSLRELSPSEREEVRRLGLCN